ncbi:MAG: bifunctional adenosylcobinamide kinase/adenosylcobinamide-phosphate guanylyltransferase [Caldilineaceae bacterium]|nr:bifunctional adenosylcobinamide kinase/adenosylcobinamide-phosphate guanylyltransferase [Caldilineaceae bacterium]
MAPSHSSLYFLLGGARSGKSDYALELARGLAGDAPILFIATAQAGDSEMAERISRHQSERPGHWQTLEAPIQVGRRWQEYPIANRQSPVPSVAVLDCLTLLVSNLLFADSADPETEAEAIFQQRVDGEIDELLAAQTALGLPLIVVSNEVGMGIVPAGRISRLYRDLLGRANRRLAGAAAHAIFLLAGIPLDLKRWQMDLPGPARPDSATE